MRFWLVLVFLCFSQTSEASQRIVTVKTIHEVASDILYDETDYWLIFDVDDVLFEGAEALSHSLWFERSRACAHWEPRNKRLGKLCTLNG